MFDDKSQILLRRANKDTLILKYLNDDIPILLKPKTVFVQFCSTQIQVSTMQSQNLGKTIHMVDTDTTGMSQMHQNIEQHVFMHAAMPPEKKTSIF